jgi:hypothetical protein
MENMTLRPLLLLLASCISLSAQIPGMDMAVMQKWSNAKVIRFSVVGNYNARTLVVSGDHEGKGDVTDKITIEYTFDNKTSKMVGEPKITNAVSTVANLKSDGTNCPPPQLKGAYEHFQSTKHMISGTTLMITGTRTFPDASVSQYPASCSMKAIRGETVERNVMITVTDARMLGMPIQSANKSITIAPDRKSFTLAGQDGWSWTYTPTLVQ